MKTISPETEKRLMNCVEKAAEFVADGSHPNDGIAKAAQEYGIRPSEVQLVVNAYNVGRTNHQRASADDILEKTADFDLADASAVLEILYPSQVKTAAAEIRDVEVSHVYGYSPRDAMARRESMTKAARALDFGSIGGVKVTAPPPLPREDRSFQQALQRDKEAQLAMEEARRKEAVALDAVADAYHELVDYFRSPAARPLPVVKEAAVMLHGERANSLFDEIVKTSPALTKMANHRVGSSFLFDGRAKMPSVDALDCKQEPFGKIATFYDKLEGYVKEKAAAAQAARRRKEVEQEALGPFVFENEEPIPLTFDELRQKAAIAGAAIGGLPGLAAVGYMANQLGQLSTVARKDQTKLVNKDLERLADPAHENQLRLINTQAMLQNLLINDPIISGYDPDEVTTAYNDMSSIAPRAAEQPMVVQDLLRRRLQQGTLDGFESTRLVDMEDKLRRREPGLAQPQGGGDASIL